MKVNSLRFKVYGLCSVVDGLWFMVCGLWFVVDGLGLVVCGLCFAVNGFWPISYGWRFVCFTPGTQTGPTGTAAGAR